MNILKQIQSFITPVTIERRKGKCTPLLEVNLKNGKYHLDGKHVNYSFGSLHNVFRRSLSHYKVKKRPINKVLILGFGAGSVAHILRYGYNMNCQIIGVEKDPVVLELGLKYFNTEKYKNIKLVCEDANDFVLNDTSKYDLIVIDIFVEDSVPEIFHTSHFLVEIKRLLNSGGILFFNKVTQSNDQKEEASALIDTMSEIFGRVEVLKMIRNSVENSVFVYTDNSNQKGIYSLHPLNGKENWLKKNIATI